LLQYLPFTGHVEHYNYPPSVFFWHKMLFVSGFIVDKDHRSAVWRRPNEATRVLNTKNNSHPDLGTLKQSSAEFL
jgi:hypothetical protein